MGVGGTLAVQFNCAAFQVGRMPEMLFEIVVRAVLRGDLAPSGFDRKKGRIPKSTSYGEPDFPNTNPLPKAHRTLHPGLSQGPTEIAPWVNVLRPGGRTKPPLLEKFGVSEPVSK